MRSRGQKAKILSLLIAIAVCAVVSAKAQPLSDSAKDDRTRVCAGLRQNIEISRSRSREFSRRMAFVPHALFRRDLAPDCELGRAKRVSDALTTDLGLAGRQPERAFGRRDTGAFAPATRNLGVPDESTHEVADSSEKTRALDHIVGAGSSGLSGPAAHVSHQGKAFISRSGWRHPLERGPPPLPV